MILIGGHDLGASWAHGIGASGFARQLIQPKQAGNVHVYALYTFSERVELMDKIIH